jgi:hypothetical protein
MAEFAIAAIGAEIGGTAGAFMIMNAGAIATAAVLAGGLALTYEQQRAAKSKARDSYNASQTDRLANVSTTVATRELVLGRVRKGGAIYFRGSAGAYKSTFLVHLALAAHEIDAVEQVYFNDEPVVIDGTGAVLTAPYLRIRRESAYAVIPAGATSVVLPQPPSDGRVVAASGGGGGSEMDATPSVIYRTSLAGQTVTLLDGAQPVDVTLSYQYDVATSYARVWWELGTPGSAADARTGELFPDLWTAAHRGAGVARLVCEFQYDETAFPSGLPAVTALLRGAKVYDPRSGLTAWSDNPALLARHVYQHPMFGKATVSAAEDARVIVAANACDAVQAYNVAGVVNAQKLYRCSLTAAYGASARSLLDDIVQAMAGMWAFAGGELYLRAGVYTAPVLALSDADLAVVQRDGASEQQDQISIAAHRERAEKFNVVNARIWDEGQGYKQVALSPLKAAALVARDGEELAQEVAFAGIGFAPQALHVAGVMMRDARDPLTVAAPFKMRAWPLELFDTVSLTLPRYGWSAKTFMVLGRVWDRSRRVVRLTLKETAAAIFTPDTQFVANGYARNTALPNPWSIAPPVLSADGIYSGTSELLLQPDGTLMTRVRVTWPAVQDASVQAGQIDVEWVVFGGAAPWQRVTVAGDRTAAYLLGAVDGQGLLIRARSRNAIATSAWSLVAMHQVVGKREPPPDVTRFTIDDLTLRWGAVQAFDLAGYRIRFAYGNNAFWDSAAPLHDGLVTDNPYTLASRPAGAVTLLIKAEDTSGNQSANAAVIYADLGPPAVQNVLLSYPEAPTFPGATTGGAVSAGVLQAANTDLFYGDAAQPFYGGDTDPFYAAGTFAQMVYEWSAVPSQEGLVQLLHTIAASDYAVDFRRDSQAAFFGPDTDLFYGDAADPFFGPPSAWTTWPGPISLMAPETLSFRITTAGGPTQGVVSQATVVLDVPDVDEVLSDVVIAGAGTRLPITKAYRAIDNVQLTVQTDGNGGTSARLEDKNATLGPLVVVRNSAGIAVPGLVDARIKGH